MGRAIVVPPPRWRGAHALALLAAVGLLGYLSPVLYPPVDLDRCRAPRDPAADTVTLINPVREKGVQIALGVAALLPHRRFLLVETWPLSGARASELAPSLARLPNVTLPPPSLAIWPVYARTKALLALSPWVEAFCTVALEANANGIPVAAARSASRALAGRS